MKRRYVVLSLAAVLALALAVPAFGGPTNIVSALTKVKKTANKALKQAQAANTAAAAAQATATGAQTDATAAGKAAKTAQTTANDGLTQAKAAQTTANTALGTANAAKTEAATAKAAADAAQATANAKFGSTQFVEGETSADATSAAALSFAFCPAGSQVTGGGYVTGGAGNHEVVPIIDSAYGNAWLADLQRIPGGASSWHVTANAICVKP
jgi:hypothetical protein